MLALMLGIIGGVAGLVIYSGSRSSGGEATTSQQPEPGGSVEVPTENGTATVSIGEIDWDANEEVAAASGANDAPPEGHVYVIVPVTMTYAGSGEFTGWFDITVTFVGADGQEYSSDSALVDDDLYLQPSITDGGTTSGNLVFLVAVEATEGGEFHVSTWETDEPRSIPAA
ncbi:hypothetical protein BF93_10375 [Brachybacterium phenoliresistens]|uniref:DUF4352 domain-containing protein n=1 Tax=Brachybacterium phenoliresistens TaxID=396014 RepID=Z9JNS0_9MICO|nr:hypothetical protein [Brachybacterium phenoliresistens]EWS79648.1 hypothetical protein BF93_10375 [Brachybacterium phenoliresistens]